MDPLLRVENIFKEYPAPTRPLSVLAGVSLALEPGQALAIMGPSGSGKSSLLNIISTLDQPTRGTVLFDGADVRRFSPEEAAAFRNREIGFVFQDHHLLPQCTAAENVLLPCLAAGAVTPDDSRRCAALLERAGLAGREAHLPGQLSGGERQRVAVARALIRGPRLLLCDEPTGNLDAENAEAIASLFIALRDEQRAALLVVTHNPQIAARLGGDVRVLRAGTLQPMCTEPS